MKEKNLSGSYSDDEITIISDDPKQRQPKMIFISENEYRMAMDSWHSRRSKLDDTIREFQASPDRCAKIPCENAKMRQSVYQTFKRLADKGNNWTVKMRANTVLLRKVP